MMMYYELVKSSEELVGTEGFLRLPAYIFDEYVFDELRHAALTKALELLRNGKNILIIGRAGTGKTAFLAVVLKRLMDQGYKVGKIINGESVGREHEGKGVFLFYDDIPRVERRTILSIIENNVKMIVATARVEELDKLARNIGDDPRKYFEYIEIREMDDEYLMMILERFARREGIEVDPRAARIVVMKAKKLPVYIWQVIRDLAIARKFRLDEEFANRIPEGMFEYVDKILWNVLGDKEDRKEVLLTLMIMTIMPEYEMHQDLFNAVFVEATREIKGTDMSSKAILLGSDTLAHICRYLTRTPRYSFRLPHDSWADVLKGKSRGLLSEEISSLVFVFPMDEQMRILKRAARRAYDEAISKSKDPARIREFFRQLNLLGIGKEAIMGAEAKVREKPRVGAAEVVKREAVPPRPTIRPVVEEKPPVVIEKPPVGIAPEIREKIRIKLYATTKKVKSYRPTTYMMVRLTDISEAILKSGTFRNTCGMSRSEALRRVMYRRVGRTWTIKYPCWGGLSITETVQPLVSGMSTEQIRDFIILLLIGFFLLIIPIIGIILFFIILFSAFSIIAGGENIYLSEISIEGDRDIVRSLVREIRTGVGRGPIHRRPKVLNAIRRRLGVSPDTIERQWYVI